MIYQPWSYTTRTLVAIVAAMGLVWLVVVASPLIQSLIVAGLLAYLLDPIVNLVLRWVRLRRIWAARLVYTLFLLILFSIPAILSALAFIQFDRIKDDFFAAVEQLQLWMAQPIMLLGLSIEPLALLDDLGQASSTALAVIPTSGALDTLANITTNLIWVVTALVSFYYFLTDGPKIKPWLVGLMAPNYRAEFHILLDEIDGAWRVFLRAQLIIFIIFVALLGVGMFLVVWLYRTRLLPLSPIGLILMLILVYALVQQVDNFIVRPYFFSEQMNLHPGLVFVSLMGALALSGVLGVIMIIPLIATLKIIGRYVHRRMLGLSPFPHIALPTSPPEEVASPPPDEVTTAPPPPMRPKTVRLTEHGPQ
jgi:predicted PurR-regulated permease PerM